MKLHHFAILAASLSLHYGIAGAADPVKLRLFVLSGQSNMSHLNPDDAFTPTVKAAYPHDEVIVVRYAGSGTPISQWWKDTKTGQGGGLYDVLMAQVKKALSGKTPDTVAFVWMQGERDAKGGMSGSYSNALHGLIQRVRDDLKHPDLAVVIGRLSDHLNGTKHWDAVRAIQEKVATEDRRGGWVDTDDLNGGNNDLHCTKEGFLKLGRRLAAKSVELLAKPASQPAKQ